MSKFLGFLLGVAVALAGPAVFGVLSAPGGVQLNTKEMALAYGVGALLFWAVVSYFSGAAAIGAFLAFGTLVYCWLWIPNRTTNFLNDVPGVTTGMIEGTRQYTLNGVVPILTVIMLVYSIQLIVRSVQRRRRARAEAERLQREQEAAQAQQEAAAAAVYPVAGSTYAEPYVAPSYEPSNRYDDLFDEEPVQPRNQADEQTAQFPVAEPTPERTSPFPVVPEDVAYSNDETVLVPSDRDETVVAAKPSEEPATAEASEETVVTEAPSDETVAAAAPAAASDETVVAAAPAAASDETVVASEPEETVVAAAPSDEDETREVAEAAPAAPPAQADAGDEATIEWSPDNLDDAPKADADTPPAPATPPPPVPAAQAEEQPAESKTDADDKGDAPKGPTGGSPAGGPVQQAPVQAAPPVREERVGQQYRERMEDPEDTGEFHVSAFEGPFHSPGVRPAGA